MSIDDAAELRGCFGNIVRARRKGLGISQEELAERAGLHRTYVADIERGARNPSLESISKLARALELSIAALFSSSDPVAPAESGVVSPDPEHATADILLVEDNPDDVKLTLRAFGQANLQNQIHVVRDGAEALEYLFRTGRNAGHKPDQRCDVILLDLRLPKVDGIEVLRRIKSDQRTRSIPVVILTASQRDEDLAECRRLGADAYIVKPVDFHRLSQVTPKLQFSWMLLKTSAGIKTITP